MRKGRRSRSRSFSSDSDEAMRGGGRLSNRRQIGLRKKSNFSSNFGDGPPASEGGGGDRQ